MSVSSSSIIACGDVL